MGCDGGSIPKRKEIVKNKQKNEGQDKDVNLAAKWLYCSLSGLPLNKPIVSCQLGRLYNKDAIIQYLLDLKTSAATASPAVNPTANHIKTLKDVKELVLKEKVDFNSNRQAPGGSEQFRAQFVCPISGLDMNGKYKFFYSLRCGCVISEKALKEVSDDKQCLVCSKPHDHEMDLIVINGDAEEVDELRKRLEERRKQSKIAKAAKKNSHSEKRANVKPQNSNNKKL